jgi:arsenical-resistance protein
MGGFERFLSLWVLAAILAGLALGQVLPGLFATLASVEYASVNLIVAVLIWAMVYPMMIGVDLRSLGGIGRKPKGLMITVAVNWLIKPFTMAALGVLFFEYLFADLIDPADAGQYIAGLILLGAAPCTAMVFVWSQLTRGDPNYTLVQVSLNDVIMVFAFAPIVAFLLGVTDIAVPWETLVLSVVLYVVIPLAAGLVTRSWLIGRGGQAAVERFTARIKPASVFGLLGPFLQRRDAQRRQHLVHDVPGVHLRHRVHVARAGLVDERVGQDHGAVLEPRVEHAALRQKMRDVEPKPPTAPSSMVMSASWWRASCRIRSSSSGLAKRASAMVGVRPRASSGLGGLLHLLQPRAEIQQRDAVALGDHAALADLQRTPRSGISTPTPSPRG